MMEAKGLATRHAGAVLIICGVWVAYLALLALLGSLGFGVGLKVWPLGEDRNWVDLLQRGGVGEIVRGFWAIDHRNPLSPWWYVAAKPIILKWSSGLFLLRHVVGLGLGLSIYALTRLLLGPSARNLAIAIGCLTAIFSANAFFDQIYWNFQAALIASILAVCCFLMHQRGDGRGGWLAGALVLWLIAIATYTIQAGAIAAIGYLALRRGARDEHARGADPIWRFAARRIATAVLATWPFAVTLIVFVMIWQTTSVPADAFISAPQPIRFFQSLRMGVWHADNQLMMAVLTLSPHRLAFIVVGIIIALIAGAALAKAGPSPRSIAAVDLLIVVMCLALPTLVVETAGAQWPPGSRWRMIYQMTTPAFYLGALHLISSIIANDAWRARLWSGVGGVLFGLAMIASLAHNERQMLLATNERQLRDVIALDATQRPLPQGRLHYLFFLDERFRWFAHEQLSRVYARTWFGADGPTFHLAPSPIYEPLQQEPPITFLDDGRGIANATASGETLPYSRVRAVVWRDGRLTVVDRLDRAETSGFRAVWERDQPVRFGAER